MKSKNIAIVVKHLGEGGAQRSAAMLSLMLCNLGYKVTFIALYGVKEFTYKGQYFVLDKGNTSFRIINKFQQIINFRRTIKSNNFDFIIDFRGRTNFLREIIINNFVYRTPRNIIFTIRESKIDNYIPKPFFWFKSFYQKACKIMVVSKEIEKKLNQKYSLENVVTINNGINFKEIDELKINHIDESGKFVVTVGRLVELKQIKQLIEVYSKSILVKNNIKLYIVGEGELETNLKLMIKQRKLESMIILLPFQTNPFKYMSKSKFLILQSKSEGFPNVLIEALACGVPVISFNCETGPSDIIQHEKNGLLVENQNFIALGDAINKLVVNDRLYGICKKNARESVEKFNMEKIALKWQELLQ